MHDWNLDKRIERYFKGTAALNPNMAPARTSRDTLELAAYSDADFAVDNADRKSLTGGVVLLNSMAASWSVKKQDGVSLSTVEAKFVAASEFAREIIELRQMVMEIDMALVIQILCTWISRLSLARSKARHQQAKKSTSTCGTSLSRTTRAAAPFEHSTSARILCSQT